MLNVGFERLGAAGASHAVQGPSIYSLAAASC